MKLTYIFSHILFKILIRQHENFIFDISIFSTNYEKIILKFIVLIALVTLRTILPVIKKIIHIKAYNFRIIQMQC
jgi:hypothetical protein